MKIKALVPALTLMVMLATIVFGPLGLAAAQGEFAATVTSQACTVTVSFMSVGPGTYFVEFWDDGELMDDPSQTVSGEAAQQLVFTYTFTEIGGSAPGIGIYIYYSDSLLETIDPYTDIDETCVPGAAPVAGCPVLVALPKQSVVGSFVTWADFYYKPGLLTSPVIGVPAGKTAWVAGLDESGEYYKVLWNCTWVWVEKDTMGPNYDKVWNGAPLPTTVVK